MRPCWYVRSACRQTRSYPETDLEEINGDLREADFWRTSRCDQVSHPLRRDSGRSRNRNRHPSPSVNASRLPGNDLRNDGIGQLRSWHISASVFNNASLISFQTYPLVGPFHRGRCKGRALSRVQLPNRPRRMTARAVIYGRASRQ